MVSLYGPRRRNSPKVLSVKEWWCMGQEGGAVEPTQVDARHGRCAVCASSVERSGLGRKGRETSPPKPIPGIECSHSLRGRHGGGGRVRCLARKVPYQTRKVPELRLI